MNKLEKDLLFYSNFCLHSNNLINNISKTQLHSKILYICIDDKKIRIPSFVTRVPSIYLVKEKKILIEDNIDIWLNSINTQSNQQQSNQQQSNAQQSNQQQSKHQQSNQQQGENIGGNEILAFHSNEMGNNMSDKYSFLDEKQNINHSFSFLDGSKEINIDQRINTPKVFNSSNTQAKSKLDTDYDKLMTDRNKDGIGKGIARI